MFGCLSNNNNLEVYIYIELVFCALHINVFVKADDPKIVDDGLHYVYINQLFPRSLVSSIRHLSYSLCINISR